MTGSSAEEPSQPDAALKTLARRVKSLRESLRLTQEELSKRIGISVSFTSLLERGERAPSYETLVAVARALEVPLAELFRDGISVQPEDPSLRLRTLREGRGWVLGVGRFAGDDLQWYRLFSLAPRPRRTLSRCDLKVTGRRQPVGGETLALLSGAVVMECVAAGQPVQIALDAAAVTGFLAWLEARPPGATLPH